MRFRVFHFTIHRKKLFLFPVLTAICSAILLMNLSISSSRADSIEDILTDASDWLLNQQQENGSFGTVNETREIDTTEAFKTLFYLEKDTAALIKVITWFDDQDQADSDFIAHKLGVLSPSNAYLDELIGTLVGRQNPDGGWGLTEKYQSSPLDTVLVLSSFTYFNLLGQGLVENSVIDSVMNYLKQTQNAAGFWSIESAPTSDIVLTATILYTLTDYILSSGYQNEALIPVITNAAAWLVNQKNGDNSWGGTEEKIATTALCYSALRRTALFDGISIPSIQNSLTWLQTEYNATPHNWNGNIYQTALALRALKDSKLLLLLEPDIKITQIITYPANPTADDSIYAAVQLKNIGKFTANNVNVEFCEANGTVCKTVSPAFEKQSVIIDQLPAGQTKHLLLNAIQLASGTYTLLARTDFADATPDNNYNTAPIAIAGGLLPDCYIPPDGITFSNNTPAVAEPITITVTVKNEGDADLSNGTWIEIFGGNPSHNPPPNSWHLNPDYWPPIYLPAVLGPGGTVQIPFTDKVFSEGRHQIYAVCDPGRYFPNDTIGDIPEKNETNNRSNAYLLVGMTDLPDIQITNLTSVPTSPTAWDSVTVSATLANPGMAAAENMEVIFYDGDPANNGFALDRKTSIVIDAGGTKTIDVPWYALAGSHNIYVVADPKNEVVESNESNNSLSQTINVSSGPAVPTTFEYFVAKEIIQVSGDNSDPNTPSLEWWDYPLLGADFRIHANGNYVRLFSVADNTHVIISTRNSLNGNYHETLYRLMNAGDIFEIPQSIAGGTLIQSDQRILAAQYDDFNWDWKMFMLSPTEAWGTDFWYAGIRSFWDMCEYTGDLPSCYYPVSGAPVYLLLTASQDDTNVNLELTETSIMATYPRDRCSLVSSSPPVMTCSLKRGETVAIGEKEKPVHNTYSGFIIPDVITEDPRKGSHITSNHPIEVHAFAPEEDYLGSSYLVFPTSILGIEYYVPYVNDPNGGNADANDKILVVATEDNTHILFDEPRNDFSGFDQKKTLLLNRGQTFAYPRDTTTILSQEPDQTYKPGTRVKSDKPIGVVFSSPEALWGDGDANQLSPKNHSINNYWLALGGKTFNQQSMGGRAFITGLFDTPTQVIVDRNYNGRYDPNPFEILDTDFVQDIQPSGQMKIKSRTMTGANYSSIYTEVKLAQAGTVEFDWEFEASTDGDLFVFDANGNPAFSVNGTNGPSSGHQSAVLPTGYSDLTWTFQKNSPGAGYGRNALWIDNILVKETASGNTILNLDFNNDFGPEFTETYHNWFACYQGITLTNPFILDETEHALRTPEIRIPFQATGNDCRCSCGAADNNTYTEMNVQLNTHGTVSFRYKLDLAPGFDYFRFSINSLLQPSLPPTTGRTNGWQEVSFPLDAGNYTLRWQFDYSYEGGRIPRDILGWIDNIFVRQDDGKYIAHYTFDNFPDKKYNVRQGEQIEIRANSGESGTNIFSLDGRPFSIVEAAIEPQGPSAMMTNLNWNLAHDSSLLDLSIEKNDITFSANPTTPNATVSISANVHNNSSQSAQNVPVSLYKGDLDSMGSDACKTQAQLKTLAVTNDTALQDYPSVFDTHIAWQDSGNIYMCDLNLNSARGGCNTSDEKITIANSSYDESGPRGSGDYVVYLEKGPNSPSGISQYAVKRYDIPEPFVLPQNVTAYVPWNASPLNSLTINGSAVVWSQFMEAENKYALFMCDPTLPQLTGAFQPTEGACYENSSKIRLTTGPSRGAPKLSGTKLVYIEWIASGAYVCDLTNASTGSCNSGNGEKMILPQSEQLVSLPEISGNIVAWTTYKENNTTHIYYCDWEKRSDGCIDPSTRTRVTKYSMSFPTHNYNAKIYGDRIIWQASNGMMQQSWLYMCQISKNGGSGGCLAHDPKIIFKTGSTPVMAMNPVISNQVAAWTHFSRNPDQSWNYDIHYSQLDDPSLNREFIGKYTIPQITAYGSATASVNTSFPKAGIYPVYACADPDNIFTEEMEHNNYASNTITVQGNITFTIYPSLDKSTYQPGEKVNLTASIMNIGNDAGDGSAEIKIFDDQMNEVTGAHITNHYFVDLIPGNATSFPRTWAIPESLIEGDYYARARVMNNGIITDEAFASFHVGTSQATGISANVTTNKVSYTANETVSVTGKIKNLSTNFTYNTLYSRIKILNPDQSVLHAFPAQTVSNLTPESLESIPLSWNTQNTSPATGYTVIITVSDDPAFTTTLGTASTTFDILGIPKLTGTLSVNPGSVEQGNNVTFDYSVTNNGNVDLAGLVLNIHIVDPATKTDVPSVPPFTNTINLPMAQTQNLSQPYANVQIPDKTYMIALTGDYGGQTYGIASGALTVTGPVGVTISGTVYGADGVTPVGAGVEVDLSVDSGMVKFTTTDANGAFSFTATPVANQPILIYAKHPDRANYVTIAKDATSAITGIKMYAGKVVISHEYFCIPVTGCGITNQNLKRAREGVGADAGQILYDVDAANIATFAPNKELQIGIGVSLNKYYRPGGNVTVYNLRNRTGLIIPENITVNVKGNWDATGGAISGITLGTTPFTFIFNGTGTQTITKGSTIINFHNLTIDNTGSTVIFNDSTAAQPLQVYNQLAVNNGSLDINSVLNLYGHMSVSSTGSILATTNVSGNITEGATLKLTGSQFHPSADPQLFEFENGSNVKFATVEIGQAGSPPTYGYAKLRGKMTLSALTGNAGRLTMNGSDPLKGCELHFVDSCSATCSDPAMQVTADQIWLESSKFSDPSKAVCAITHDDSSGRINLTGGKIRWFGQDFRLKNVQYETSDVLPAGTTLVVEGTAPSMLFGMEVGTGATLNLAGNVILSHDPSYGYGLVVKSGGTVLANDRTLDISYPRANYTPGRTICFSNGCTTYGEYYVFKIEAGATFTANAGTTIKAKQTKMYAGSAYIGNLSVENSPENPTITKGTLTYEDIAVNHLSIAQGAGLSNEDKIISVRGNWNNQGSYGPANKGTVKFAADTAPTIGTISNVNLTSFNHLLVNGDSTDTWTIQNSLYNTGNLTVQSGTLAVGTDSLLNVGPSGNLTVQTGATLDARNAGEVDVYGLGYSRALIITGDATVNGTLKLPNTARPCRSIFYSDFTVGSAGMITNGSSSAIVFDGYGKKFDGVTMRPYNVTFNNSSSIQFYKAIFQNHNSYPSESNFWNLQINGGQNPKTTFIAFEADGGTLTLASDTTLYARALASSGTTLDALNGHIVATMELYLEHGTLIAPKPGNNFLVYGNWHKSAGALTHSSGKVTFLTIVADTENTVNGETTFYDFTNVTPGGRLRFEAGKTQTILGALELKGANGNLLKLRSSEDDGDGDPSDQWKIDPQGTRDVQYLDVKDSNNLAAVIDARGTGSISESQNNVKWWFDNQAPAMTLDPAGDQSVDEGASLVINISLADRENDPVPTLTVTPLEGFMNLVYNPGTKTGTLTLTPGFDAASTYPVTFSATDNPPAGNPETGTIPVTYTVIGVDSTPPSTTIEIQPPAPYISPAPANMPYIQWKNGVTQQFVITSTDTETGVQYIEWKFTGDAAYTHVNGAAPITIAWANRQDLTEGLKTLSARAQDIAGNLETPDETYEVTIDNTPPTFAVTANGIPQAGPSVFLVRNTSLRIEALDTLSGIQLFEINNDGAGWEESATNPWNSLDYWTTGPHTVSYRARDNVGNQSAEFTLSVTIQDKVRVILVLDESGSMDSGGSMKFINMTNAVRDFVSAFQDGDRMGLIWFDGNITRYPPVTSPLKLLTDEAPDLIGNINSYCAPGTTIPGSPGCNAAGNTNLYNAIALSDAGSLWWLQSQPPDPTFMQAVIVLSDGADTISSLTLAQARNALDLYQPGKPFVIFTIGYEPSNPAKDALIELATSTDCTDPNPNNCSYTGPYGRYFDANSADVNCIYCTIGEILGSGQNCSGVCGVAAPQGTMTRLAPPAETASDYSVSIFYNPALKTLSDGTQVLSSAKTTVGLKVVDIKTNREISTREFLAKSYRFDNLAWIKYSKPVLIPLNATTLEYKFVDSGENIISEKVTLPRRK